ncbi:MAG: hypothetical protein KIS61_01965 [Candidatus Eremiobacteraeota bacterium]|nr:hypothetical protein [Candidatus Eremiobacteraeota bacterium]
MSLIAAGLCLLMAIPPALLGMAGAVYSWQGQAPAGDFLVLPQVLRDLAPQWVGILGLCAVAGAIMSSVDASIYSAASMFSWNIMHRILRPSEDPSLLARTNRRAIMVLGTAGTLIALNVRSIYTLWFLSADLVYVLLFPQLLVVLYLRQASARGVLAGMAVALFLRLGGGEAALGIPAWLPYGFDFPFKTVAMLCGLLVTVVFSRLLPGGTRPVPWLPQAL